MYKYNYIYTITRVQRDQAKQKKVYVLLILCHECVFF